MPNETPAGTTPERDLTFDDIFGETPASQPQAAPLDPAASQTPPEIPATPAEPFLRASTGTVYLTPEDAVRGTEEKDRRIEQLRQWAIARTGYDPIDGKPVSFTPPQEELNYAVSPDKFYSDLAAANNANNGRGDPAKFASVMQKWQSDTMAPYLPVMTQSAKIMAQSAVSKEIPGFAEFVGSEKYNQYLEARPILKSAVVGAENDPRMAAQLRDLYILAYEGANGRSLPEILRNAKPQTNVTQEPSSPAQPRPTLTPSTPTLGQPSSGVHDLSTSEGRKAIVDQGKQKFGNLGSAVWGT